MSKQNGQIWLIASGKGGTGKSTLAVNLGAALAEEGRKVLLLDLNLGLRCLDLLLGVEDRVLYDLMDVLEGLCRPGEATIKCPTVPNLDLIPAAQNRKQEEFAGNHLRLCCEGLRDEYDYIFLDCPPGFGPASMQAASVADCGLLVSSADAVSIRDTDRAVAEFSMVGLNQMFLAINRFRSDWIKSGFISAANEIAEMIGMPLMLALPESEEVLLASLLQKPVILDSPNGDAARLFRKWAGDFPGKESQQE